MGILLLNGVGHLGEPGYSNVLSTVLKVKSREAVKPREISDAGRKAQHPSIETLVGACRIVSENIGDAVVIKVLFFFLFNFLEVAVT